MIAANCLSQPQPPSETSTFTPAAWAEQRERAKRVRDAVLELPPEFQEAVVLCELDEMSYEEAAQAIGCPIGTVYVTKSNILKWLRQNREELGEDLFG